MIEIPAGALEIAKDHIRNDEDDDADAREVAEVVLTDAAPLIVAAELRRVASWFPAVRDPEGDETQLAYETGKYAITSVLLRRADELDQQGGESR